MFSFINLKFCWRNGLQLSLGVVRERLEEICQGKAGADIIQPLLETFEKRLTDYKIVMRDEFVELENEVC